MTCSATPLGAIADSSSVTNVVYGSPALCLDPASAPTAYLVRNLRAQETCVSTFDGGSGTSSVLFEGGEIGRDNAKTAPIFQCIGFTHSIDTHLFHSFA